jgi:hypothetical protein
MQHDAILYWLAMLFWAVAFYRHKRRPTFIGLTLGQVLLGIFLTVRPVLGSLQSNFQSYGWSVTFLLLAIVAAALELSLCLVEDESTTQSPYLLACSGAAFAGAIVALASAAGAYVVRSAEHGPAIDVKQIETLAWSLVTHLFAALMVVCMLNLIRLISLRLPHTRIVRTALISGLAWLGLWMALTRYLHNALDFRGTQAQVYSALLATALVFVGSAVVLPFPSCLNLRVKAFFVATDGAVGLRSLA